MMEKMDGEEKEVHLGAKIEFEKPALFVGCGYSLFYLQLTPGGATTVRPGRSISISIGISSSSFD